MAQPQLTRDSMIGPFPLPPVDESLRGQARSMPGQWIGFTDPAIDPSTPDPPQFAVQGGYRADENGQIVDYSINPHYEPSEQCAGFRCRSSFELTLWRALNGFNPMGMLADAFRDATLLAYAERPGDDQIPAVADPHQPDVFLLLLCSSRAFCSWEHVNEVTGSFVLELAGHTDGVLTINPGTDLSLRIEAWDMANLAHAAAPAEHRQRR